jgi:hypothetical protein
VIINLNDSFRIFIEREKRMPQYYKELDELKISQVQLSNEELSLRAKYENVI